MEENKKIAVFGSGGMVGSSICRNIRFQNHRHTILKPRSKELDLTDKNSVNNWFSWNKPDYVFLAAAKVGGIQANINNPVEFGIENIEIINNVLSASHKNKVSKLLFLGSSCIYPKDCPQPMKEEYLFSGKFEPTNEMYAISKAYGLRLCSAFRKEYGCNFISCQPCNIFGPGDNFSPLNSHVVAALIRKFHEAKIKNVKEVVCWGDGSARREIIYSEEIGNACVFLMDNYNDDQFLNVGMGTDLTIKELTEKISNIIGYSGTIIWDTEKPSGMKQKLLDCSKINNLGWKPQYNTDETLQWTYNWFVQNIKDTK